MAGYRELGEEIPRGDSAILDGVVTLSGVAQNITGWVLWCTAKYRLSDPDSAAVFQKKTGGLGVVVPNPALGAFYVQIVSADTSGLPAHAVKLFADAQAKDPAGNIYTLDRVLLPIEPDTTISTT